MACSFIELGDEMVTLLSMEKQMEDCNLMKICTKYHQFVSNGLNAESL